MSVHFLAQTNTHYLYAMLCQDAGGPGYVKFGRSGQIGTRLSALRTGCPIPARFFAIIPAFNRDESVLVERELHRHFQGRRIKGEWYRFDFQSEEDKREFNDGCRLVFNRHMRKNEGWTKISVAALDHYARQRRVEFLHSKRRRQIEGRARREDTQRRAWKELDSYGA